MNSKTLKFDIVIIGSGAGGGTVAKELAPLCQSGCRIALLEWGGRFMAKDNTRDELTMAERYYFESGGFQTRSQDMTLAFAKALGGSTNVYTGTSLKAPKHVLDAWAVPGISQEELEPRYKKYIVENNVHFLNGPEINENNRHFVTGCRQLNWRVEQFPVNTKGCAGLGTCNLGCARLAKQGTAQVQIPMAEKQGIEVITFCRAHTICGHEILAEVLPPQYGLQPSSLDPGWYRFVSKKIIVCAGSINTPALLLRSFGNRLSPALGRYFTCHPAVIVAGEHPAPIQNIAGHPKSFYCDAFSRSKRFLLETCMYFPFTLSKSLTGFGQEVDDLIARYEHLQMILVLALDSPQKENGISIDATGQPVVDYRFSQETIQALVDGIKASADILFAAGAKRLHAPSAQTFFLNQQEQTQLAASAFTPLPNPPPQGGRGQIDKKHFKLGQITISAAHLMGGARMGTDPNTSVTNAWGKVHGQEDLYVADASLFPAAIEINPYLTIMALADRVAEGVKRDIR